MCGIKGLKFSAIQSANSRCVEDARFLLFCRGLACFKYFSLQNLTSKWIKLHSSTVVYLRRNRNIYSSNHTCTTFATVCIISTNPLQSHLCSYAGVEPPNSQSQKANRLRWPHKHMHQQRVAAHAVIVVFSSSQSREPMSTGELLFVLGKGI